MKSNLDEQLCILRYYYSILSRLVKQKAISIPTSFIDNGKFSLENLQKIVEQIFIQSSDRIMFECILKEELKYQAFKRDPKATSLQNKINVMSFGQLTFYKTLPCPLWDKCSMRPREIAPANQYLDDEFSCYYYHHDKDKRRIVISSNLKEDFVYTANYKKTKGSENLEKYSLNYFESIFHPIYYKLFQCKRNKCSQINLCPFIHCDLENSIWEETFQKYTLKPRDLLTKKKAINSSIFSNKNYHQNELFPEKFQIQSLPEYSAFLNFNHKNDTIPYNSSSHIRPTKIGINLKSKEYTGFISPNTTLNKNHMEEVSKIADSLGEKHLVSKSKPIQSKIIYNVEDSYNGESDTSFDIELMRPSKSNRFSQSHHDNFGKGVESLNFIKDTGGNINEIRQFHANSSFKFYNVPISMNDNNKIQYYFNQSKDNLKPTDPNLPLYFDMNLMKNLHNMKSFK